MTQMDALITTHGQEATIYQRTLGSAGSYGHLTETWTALGSTEYVWVSERGASFAQILAGRMDTTRINLHLLSDTSIEEGNYIVIGSNKYMVGQLKSRKMFNIVQSYVAEGNHLEDGS